MAEPRIPQKGPYIMQLEPGEYWWCACGRSQQQPFCDGSHADTEFSPVRMEITSKAPVAVCGCKHSQDRPFCDGSHSSL